MSANVQERCPIRRAEPARRRLATAATAVALLAACGCRGEMYNQPRFEPQEATAIFADGTSSRPLVEGVVPQGAESAGVLSNEPSALLPVAVGDPRAATSPYPVDRAFLERGQERYRIFCTPCHGEAGDGRGIIVQRGFTQPPAFARADLLQQPLGHFVDVITRGQGAMYSYAARIAPRDRWAIASYIRALQLSQHAVAADLPEEDRNKLQGVKNEPAGR
ncbi:c-type cytochrome [Aquisphaera insulae]|uniref:c-type cytochrome n=1 Tax=Aquisphaera insulae TaxID=2712864 RepID=UPI0013EAE3FB|nr:cytochrome c [Aquisphaera insulae]